MAEDPSYEELYEENLELLEEKEKLTAKVRELEGASASGRDASRLGEQTTAALQRAQADLAAARLEASDRGRAVDALKKRQEGWDNEKANLEQALSDKDDRLRLALKGTQKLDGHKDAQREERRKQTTTQRELLESAAENESMRAEVSTLTSQLGVLTGALTVAAAERDEILAMRDAADAAHDDAEARFDAATLDVDEAHAQLERAAAEQAALQKKLENFNEASARREAALRSELVEFQDEVQKLRQTTKVGAFTSQLDSSAAALSQERAENERLDAENVELAVLADFLRQRVELLEKGEANSESSEAGKLRDDFAQAETKLAEADSRHTSLEDEIARLEAELADDRELLAMAAERGGMGVAEAVRRNKRMKVLLRDRERQIEKGADRLAVQVEASEFLHASIARFKLVLDGAGDALTALATDADEEALAVECKACADKDFMFDGVELRGDSLSRVAQLEAAHQQVEQQLDDLEEERLRLLKRLRDTAMHVSDKGVRFVGLTQQQLEQVRNFAARLRSSAEEDEAFLAQQTFDNDDFTGGSSMQRRALAKVKAARVQDQLAICRLEERLRGLKRALRKATGGSIEDSLEGDVDADDFEAGDPPELAALLRRELGSLTEALQLGGSRNEPAAQPCEPHLAKMLEVIQAQERNGAELAARLDDARAEVAALRASAVGGGPASPRVRETPSFRGAQPKSPRGEEEDVASFAFAGVTVRAAGYQGAAANRQTGANQTPLHFGHNAGGDTVRSGYTQFGISQTPRTTQGRAHLDRMTRGLKLPDEAWAGELRDAHAALAEALEALSESGQECAEQGAALALLSGRYALARQHVAVLYDEHVQYVEKAQALDVQRLADISRLREQKELAEVEAANSKRLAQVLEEGDSLKLECRDLTRRVTHFEMNEMLLRRRYAIAEESRIGEAQRRIGAERALSELEASLRGRILYLELWKQGASSRVDRLQAELAESVPANLACARNAELEALRDEHVELIRDAASLRAELTRLRDCPRMVVHSKQAEDSAKVARVRAEAELSAVSARLAVYVDKSVSSANPDVKRLVQELAQLRGDKSRLEVEVAIFKEAAGLATARANSATEDSERSRERCQVAEDEARDARDQAADARRNASRALQRLGDAATVEQASVLRAAARAAQDLCSGLKRENFRLAELASIASAQAAAFARQKDEAAADHAAVLERAAALEARSDDDRHIGKLQRELLAVKATYRLFASKYEALRGALRRKEATACKAEAQLDARDEALVALRDERHAQVEALRRALGEISRCVAPAHRARASKAGADALALAHGSAGVRGGRLAAFGDSADDLAQDENSTKWTNALMVDDRVDAARHLGREIFALQNQARGRESELAASEAAREVLEDRASGLELERDAATQLLNDLLAAQGLGATGTGSTSRNLAAGQAAKRILVLSEEVKSVKLQNIVEKRELVSLRDSNRRLQASVAASEDALATADRARVEAEAKALLHVGNAFSPEGGDECFGSKKPLLGVDPRALAALALQLGMGSAELGTGRSIQGTSAALANVRLDEASERANAAHKGALELANDVREARQLASCAKQGEEEALRNAALLARAVDYYERTSGESAQDAVPGLAAAKAFLKQRGVAGGATLSPRTRPAQRDAFDRNDQSRLQAIATQTIASLKALVAEKNRALALAESRLEEGREAFRREAVADRAEIERLTEKVYREHEDAIDQLRGAAATIARADANAGGQEDGGGILSRRLEQVACGPASGMCRRGEPDCHLATASSCDLHGRGCTSMMGCWWPSSASRG
mmetsp:Transcript_4989/g.17572  ORF Transcript_4989/g.17572 Transcript_4989/m.17572 type:complete len:1787 (+) Transcript_4989:187-5547(+)